MSDPGTTPRLAGLRRLPFWPRSLQGQVLMTIALALLAGQAISAALIWRAQHERRMAVLVNTAAFRLLGPPGRRPDGHGGDSGSGPHHDHDHGPPPFTAGPPGDTPPTPPSSITNAGPPRNPQAMPPGGPLRTRVERTDPRRPGDERQHSLEHELAELLAFQGLEKARVSAVERDMASDPMGRQWLASRRDLMRGPRDGLPSKVVVVALQRGEGEWLVTRLIMPDTDRDLLMTLLGQTLLLYIVLLGATALVVRHIARPLAALTTRVEAFARKPGSPGQLEPAGPDDLRRLIDAHNAMENGIARLLDEKDVMLGAIGHDLKTPLAALRVRVESVDDDTDRSRMVSVIEDINRTLDDILSLARVGRPSDPLEQSDLRALTSAVVEEFEDMGDPVSFDGAERVIVPLRATWLRRALRNLISNAVRYGGGARVSLAREGACAVLRVEDDGPGIPEADLARMLQPFVRLESSRNSGTGGTGIGLTLARAIAEQHGGSLVLANRTGGGTGLIAALRLPLV